jgi:membrane protease YdiL (CAAX protease family)
MVDDFQPMAFATPRGQSSGMIVMSLLVVFLPLPLAMSLAAWTQMDALALAGIPTSLGLAWLALRLRGAGWADVGLRRGVSLVRLLITVPLATIALMVLTILLGSLLASATGQTPDLSRFESLNGNMMALMSWLAIVWTIAAFGEEMLFRGLLLNSLFDLFRTHARRGWAWVLALLLTAAVFGAAHAYQGVAGVLLSGFIGLGFGVVYVTTRRNLWAAILTHGLYDTVGFVILFISLG